ncbi:helix-turn-helix domain-containing protein [Staphylococcus nepalensis]|uniref:Helix-turn-helix domain-containing protein n=2 Tax=Staphylococcus nepalensis TaxID=214473 RepID=A0ABS3L643_9STAP|nr:helix-turn-helix domain-containing protein [Staphylococcus nepalensis]MBO1217381.1 helix-turn-helix domain-containing protein [Staphylococcus nepalensis]MBO1228191.1 helix-turn-helix domain-containing protein [Staphylococcus nepalensis]MBO1233723.1 helix-turn-helix domain-containing protein [Staphylococcus nepalensis]MBO1236588.1 helix-turn-helix domain-containing protein [Staphylococcus nepalensis]
MYKEELGVQISKTDISQYVNGKVNPGQNKLYILAKILNVSEAWLLGYNVEKERIDDITRNKMNEQLETLPVKQIPVVSQISAGLPIYSEENLIDYTYIATKDLNDDKELFGLKVSGDSMNKIFQDGEVVVIEKDSVIENGQIGVVMVNGYNGTLKRIRYNGSQLMLLPESTNPEHLPQVYSDESEIKIIGKVVASVKKF